MLYFCCGMIRSGSTWQYNIVKAILESRNIAAAYGFTGGEKKIIELKGTNDNLIIKLHESFTSALDEVSSGHAKAIYSHRDMRDVAASLMVLYHKDLPWVIDKGYLKDAWKNYTRWTGTKNILIQTYDYIMQSPAAAIREIAGYLGVELTEEEIKSLTSDYGIENQKKKIDTMPGSAAGTKMIRKIRRQIGNSLYNTIGKEKTKKIAALFGRIGVEHIDKKTLLHSEHINTGEIGSYKKVMTKKDIEILEKYLETITKISA